jgi:hypothetical protein
MPGGQLLRKWAETRFLGQIRKMFRDQVHHAVTNTFDLFR